MGRDAAEAQLAELLAYGAVRPAKSPGDKKSASITVRAREDLRENLLRSAEANGRSISEEAEARLVQSVADDAIGGGC